MPFQSQAQREMFYAKAKHSKKFARMAKEFEAATPKGARLPKRVKPKK